MKILLKILLGLLTITPILSALLLLADESIGFRIPYQTTRYLDATFWTLLPCLAVIYFTILYNTDKLKSDTKALWFCLILVGHIIVLPVYFFVNVWKEKKEVISETTD